MKYIKGNKEGKVREGENVRERKRESERGNDINQLLLW